MTTVVLLVLAGIWAAVIIAPMVRARAEGTPADSIGSFRRQLSVLERAAPNVVHPANRLRVNDPMAAIPPYRPQAAYATLPRPAHPGSRTGQQVRKRRREVFFALLAGSGGSLLLSLLPGLGIMLLLFALFAVLLAGYVGLLIRLRNLAAEREMKLRFLPAPATVEPPTSGRARAVGEAPPVLIRRPANS